MNGLIPLGIPLSELTQLLTTGLSLGAPTPPDEPEVSGGALQVDLPKIIVDDEDADFTSQAFAIPSGATRITWQCFGTGVDVSLQGSLDFTHFSQIDSMADEEVNTLRAGPTSLRAVVSGGGTGITVIVTAKREKL